MRAQNNENAEDKSAKKTSEILMSHFLLIFGIYTHVNNIAFSIYKCDVIILTKFS